MYQHQDNPSLTKTTFLLICFHLKTAFNNKNEVHKHKHFCRVSEIIFDYTIMPENTYHVTIHMH